MTTTIGPNTRIEGRIEGDDDVVVEGRVEGTIVLSDSLTILDGALVSGDVHVRILVVEGALSGTVRASELVHLRATAQVSAEIYAAAVRMDSGARLQGRVEMDVNAAPPAPRKTERPAQKPRREPASQPTRREEPRRAEERPEPSPAPATRAPVEEPERPQPREERGAAAAPASRPSKTTTQTIDPDEMTVKELRDMLKAHDLPVSGTKQDLVDRLREVE